MMKNTACGDEGVAGKVVRERMKRWAKEQEESKEEGNENEYDWVGRLLGELRWMETGHGVRSGLAERVCDRGVAWKEVKGEIKELAEREVRRKQE